MIKRFRNETYKEWLARLREREKKKRERKKKKKEEKRMSKCYNCGRMISLGKAIPVGREIIGVKCWFCGFFNRFKFNMKKKTWTHEKED